MTKIEDGVFGKCYSLTSVTIPNSVKVIDRDAFYDCRNLTSITIPSSVTSIEYSAFENCEKLQKVISKIVKPFEIDESVFDDNRNYQNTYSRATLYVPKGTVAKYKATESWKKPKHVWLRKTHIVNITMMLKSEAISHGLLGEEYTDFAEKMREILDRYNGTAFEGFTGDEVLSGIDPTRGTELCSVVEQMYSYEHLFAQTGDNKWAERLEVIGFNALPATLTEDMWAHQYVQMVNQIACERTMIMAPFSTNGPKAHTFGLQPNFGCCTANFNQGWPKFTLSAFMHRDNTVISPVMIPCVLKDSGITVSLETDYPFRNRARYTIDSEKDFTFIIRIPSFARNLKVNGESAETKDIETEIVPGHSEITVEFDAPAHLKERPNGLYALQAGSLLFSLPIKYEKKMREYTRLGVERKFPYCDYQFIPKSPWNYGFCDDSFEIQYNDTGKYPFSAANPPVTVKAKMQKINWGLKFPYRTVCRKTPKSRKPLSGPEEAELCPYGCAKLRMTEMPLIGGNDRQK